MKNTSINLILRQLFLISLLAILPVGCATDNEEKQQTVVELTEIENIIHFDFDRADLSEGAKAKLRQISLQLLDSERRIKIAGHADARGSHEYNIRLGFRRGKAVKEFLTSFGVDAAKLSIVSYGETNPIAEKSNPQAWAQNRRVELTIVESSQATLFR